MHNINDKKNTYIQILYMKACSAAYTIYKRGSNISVISGISMPRNTFPSAHECFDDKCTVCFTTTTIIFFWCRFFHASRRSALSMKHYSILLLLLIQNDYLFIFYYLLLVCFYSGVCYCVLVCQCAIEFSKIYTNICTIKKFRVHIKMIHLLCNCEEHISKGQKKKITEFEKQLKCIFYIFEMKRNVQIEKQMDKYTKH